MLALAAVVLVSAEGGLVGAAAARPASVRPALRRRRRCSACSSCCSTAPSDDAGLTPLVAARLASVALVVVVALVGRRSLRVPRAALPLVVASGVGDMTANALFLLATQQDGQLAITGVLASLYPVSTVVLAQVVLRERLVRAQIAGLGAAVAAVVLISAPGLNRSLLREKRAGSARARGARRADGSTCDPSTRAPSTRRCAPAAMRSVFQPIVELDTGRVVAYEALARGPRGPARAPRPALRRRARRPAGSPSSTSSAAPPPSAAPSTHGLLAPLTLFVNVEPEVLDTAPLDDLLAIAEAAPGRAAGRPGDHRAGAGRPPGGAAPHRRARARAGLGRRPRRRGRRPDVAGVHAAAAPRRRQARPAAGPGAARARGRARS